VPYFPLILETKLRFDHMDLGATFSKGLGKVPTSVSRGSSTFEEILKKTPPQNTISQS
jgi:hypothetical protein